ncbi:MAG: F0F1 ATP synthase subunit B' [Alphaproteobacteria bacterium]|nr:F0F1 ATP synthase subunit B' [Alphaproteobacteria bacterium]
MAETDHDAHDATVETATVAHGDAGHSGSFPPFDPTYFPSQIFWLVIAFGALYVMMSRVALPRIAGVLEERRLRIATDLDKAEELRAESEAAIAAYEAALAEARTKALAIANETRGRITGEIDALKAETDADLKLKLSEAEASIDAMKENALARVRGIASEAMVAIIEQVLGQAVDRETAGRYIDAEFSARR